MSDLLDDYTKATFPFELMRGSRHIRLLATIGDRVVGVTYYPGREGHSESLSMTLDWDGRGRFGNGQYPDMDLPPPPAMVAERVAQLKDERAAAQGRLDGMPDAPAEWRGIDERRIAQIDRTISQLLGQPEGELEANSKEAANG